MKRTIALLSVMLLVNSIQAQEVEASYPPLTVKGNSIYLPGKQLDLNADGFPAMVQTSFKLVTEPIHFHLPRLVNHKDIKFKSGALDISKPTPDKVNWMVNNTSDSLDMEVKGSLNLHGMMIYVVKITALNDIDLENIRLHIPFTPEAAKYVKGLNQKGDERDPAIDWKWSATGKKEAKVWIGNPAGGLLYTLENNGYKNTPASWSNGDKGGVHIEQKGKAILADNYSGERHLKKGDVLYYNFNMSITAHQNTK
ncbi:glycoside hydrolase domain-containing protein [Pedobacter heparinus]|uniref:glycoside hydrolase domain-containing protein n=1 Tax=Pedobacter heparinus TaxID=984 RepID=UPI00292EAFF2|nr:glycoside hydrolase domain-containing protein [Pedobacter heparinus]